MSDRWQDGLRAEIAVRVGDPLYATGKMTILENSEPVTPKIVERWRGEVLALRSSIDASEQSTH
jgi:hypothetical protein